MKRYHTSGGGGAMLVGDELSLDGDEMASVFAKYFPLKFCFDNYMQIKPQMCTLPTSKTSTSNVGESQEALAKLIYGRLLLLHVYDVIQCDKSTRAPSICHTAALVQH